LRGKRHADDYPRWEQEEPLLSYLADLVFARERVKLTAVVSERIRAVVVVLAVTKMIVDGPSPDVVMWSLGRSC